jgi:hypothetical protein
MRRALAISIILGSLTSCVSFIHHDQDMAAEAARAFAQAAFVDRDDAKARELLSPSLAQGLTAEKLTEQIARLHPGSFPTRVTVTEYEPMMGQRAMMIYLKGANDGEDFYYRFVMEGDATLGYRVAGLFRGNGPHPPSTRRPLGQSASRTDSI